MIDSHFDPQLANLSHASAMAFQAHLIFILQLVVAVSTCNIALKECEADNSSKLGFVLVGYAFKSDGQEISTKILISWQELKNRFLSFFVHK